MPQEEQAMLKRRRHVKPGKDERDDQDVVERERQFDDVAGGKLDRLFLTAPIRHDAGAASPFA
jgi:hypothetical protein